MSSKKANFANEDEKVLLACNVYISASGKIQHEKEILLSLLQETQAHCQEIRGKSKSSITVVHAYADNVYNRSSIHLAGRAPMVTNVASKLTLSALLQLHAATLEEEEEGGGGGEKDSSSLHPYVGLVDHVAVMPLLVPFPSFLGHGEMFDTVDFNDCKEGVVFQQRVAGRSAKRIGQDLARACENAGDFATVHYYGSATEGNVPLAKVRRELTNFFKSGGLSRPPQEKTQSEPARMVTCIGAPSKFTENFNVRLRFNAKRNSTCGGKDSAKQLRSAAVSLCRTIREKDGGLTGVEGLTIPYSNGMYEIACNLLQPDVSTREDIQCVTERWVEAYNRNLGNEDVIFIDDMYGVGTTQRTCLDALNHSSQDEMAQDEEVMSRFKDFLS